MLHHVALPCVCSVETVPDARGLLVISLDFASLAAMKPKGIECSQDSVHVGDCLLAWRDLTFDAAGHGLLRFLVINAWQQIFVTAGGLSAVLGPLSLLLVNQTLCHVPVLQYRRRHHDPEQHDTGFMAPLVTGGTAPMLRTRSHPAAVHSDPRDTEIAYAQAHILMGKCRRRMAHWRETIDFCAAKCFRCLIGA